MVRLGILIGSLALVARVAPATALPAPADTARPAPPSRKIVVQYDSRYSILNYYFCTINGLKLGLEWPGRARVGGAIYFLSTGIPTRQPRPDNAALDAQAELRFRYLAGYGEYVLLETPRWELSGNLQLGLGSAHLRYENVEGEFDRTPKRFMGVLEPSVAAQLRIFKWAGLGAGAGWRQPIFTSAAIQRELNGPIFYLRAKLFLGDFVRVVRGREPLFTQEGLRKE
ncbi:hypothetical protein GCM10023185_16960 [Hymenobacter saemangeumensis]|uniref:DUF3575 domain-containing protein n=2 Tax=Hymenobacter saemangeumensis TaxID=1084522 RepID=A0ABP8IAD2_9BACT